MIGSIYDYYYSTYYNSNNLSPKSQTHKKSELRSIYNNIVKISKSSPLYKVDVSSDIQKYAIDIKENARSLSNDISNLNSEEFSGFASTYSSDNNDVVSVRSLNPEDESDNEYSFVVDNLATPQVNTGNYLRDDTLSLEKGEHAFEVNIDNSAYEFQFKVNDNDTNKSVLEKLSRLINRSGIGLSSAVLRAGGASSLEITSDSTGLGFKPTIFEITESSSNSSDNIVSRLGIDNVTSYPESAHFSINGNEQTSANNKFTINNSLEITLNGTSENGQATNISKKDNVSTVLDSVQSLLDSYNNLVALNESDASDVSNFSNESSDSTSLVTSNYGVAVNNYIGKSFTNINKEMLRTANSYKSDLESVGITMDDSGKLSLDEALFTQVADEDSLSGALDKINDFRSSLSAKSYDISINPMKYVDKTMISYPNPVKEMNFANPYMTSIYTGMMYDGYI